MAARDALTVLRYIEDDDSGVVSTVVDAVLPCLGDDRNRVQAEATHLISLVAHADVADVRPASRSLERIITKQEPGLKHALYAYVPISREDPRTVASMRGQVADVIIADEYGSSVRTNATAVLGNLVEDEPRYGPALVDSVASLLDVADPKLRNNAVAFIYDAARIHSGVVEPHLDTLVELTGVDDEFTRVNATGTIARFAEDHPDTASGTIPVAIKGLTDESWKVRENACYILGYVAPQFATPALETRAKEDANRDVRSRAVWALDKIEESNLS